MTTRLRGGLYSKDESTTASAVVTLGSMTTEPRGAPISGAMMSPTSIDISHHLSPQARTPREAHRSAYSANASFVASGIAPRECETRYLVRLRIGKRSRKRRSVSAAGARVMPSPRNRHHKTSTLFLYEIQSPLPADTSAPRCTAALRAARLPTRTPPSG